MRIVVLGAGQMGGRLASLWSAAGHAVETVHRRDRGTAADCTAGAEAVALCVPWSSAEAALAACGDLDGKILVDCTNPITPGFDGLLFGGTMSAAEQIQALHPGARVVKAFNSLGAPLLGNAAFGNQIADGYFCGDDAAAKCATEALIRAAGLNPMDAGPLRNARYLEAMAMLWIDLAVHQGRGAHFAFKTLTR